MSARGLDGQFFRLLLYRYVQNKQGTDRTNVTQAAWITDRIPVLIVAECIYNLSTAGETNGIFTVSAFAALMISVPE